jgi:hypothetical protein
MRRQRLTPARRAQAWIVTGPVGHLAGGLLDWCELVVQLAWARARRD